MYQKVVRYKVSVSDGDGASKEECTGLLTDGLQQCREIALGQCGD